MASCWVHHTCLQLMLAGNCSRVIQDSVAIYLAGRCSPCLVSHGRWCHGCARVYVWSSLTLAFEVVCALLATKRDAPPQSLLRYHLLWSCWFCTKQNYLCLRKHVASKSFLNLGDLRFWCSHLETLPKYESLLNLPLGIYFLLLYSMEIIERVIIGVTSLVIMALRCHLDIGCSASGSIMDFVLGVEQVVDLTIFCALEPWVRNDPLWALPLVSFRNDLLYSYLVSFDLAQRFADAQATMAIG